MESLQHLKRRLKGIQNIGQITKAMELVAATKMRRSQEIALNSRPYAFTGFELLANLSATIDPALIEELPLFHKRPVVRSALVVVTSDKGLAGSFNAAVLRAAEKFLTSRSITPENATYEFIAIGQKAANYFTKKKFPIEKSFIRVGDYTTPGEIAPIAEYLTHGYEKQLWDEVFVISMNFRTALRQEVIVRKLFPVDFAAIMKMVDELLPERGRYAEFRRAGSQQQATGSQQLIEYLIEPSPQEVLRELASHLVAMHVYHVVLEANASEHAARRLAMKNASDNAEELQAELTLTYNKSRQATITRELVEITSSAEALQ